MGTAAERVEEKEASPKTLPPITFHELVMSWFQPNVQHPRPQEQTEKKHGKRSVKP